MVQTIPPIRGFMEGAIERNPLIFHWSLEDQYLTLVVHPRPLLAAGVNGQLPLLLLIVIDGLDECTDGTRYEIVDIALCRAKDAGTNVTRIALDTVALASLIVQPSSEAAAAIRLSGRISDEILVTHDERVQ